MVTKFEPGEKISPKNITFIIDEININSKDQVHYKIAVMSNVVNLHGYPDGIPVGYFGVSEEHLEKYIEEGATF